MAARAGAVELWRLSFPSAVACTLWQGRSVDNPHVTDADLVLLRGVHYLNMGGCTHVTNATSWRRSCSGRTTPTDIQVSACYVHDGRFIFQFDGYSNLGHEWVQ